MELGPAPGARSGSAEGRERARARGRLTGARERLRRRGRAARAREGAAGAQGRRAEAGGGEPKGWKPAAAAAAAAAERGQFSVVFANVGAVCKVSLARR